MKQSPLHLEASSLPFGFLHLSPTVMNMILEVIYYVVIFTVSFLALQLMSSMLLKRYNRLPPGPLGLPIIGHLHLVGPFLHHSFHDLASKYGPLIYVRLGSVNVVVASTPELAKQLLKTNELTFSTRKHSIAIDYLTYNSSFAFAPYGPYWKFIKKLSTIELLGSRTMNQFLPIRSAELRHFIKCLLDKSADGESVNVTEELLKLTNNVISQMMFSRRCSGTEGEAGDTRKVVRQVTEIFGEFNVADVIWFCKNLDLQGFRKRFEGIHKQYDSLLERIMRDREALRKEKKKNDVEVKDFLDIMFDALENDNSEVQLTRDHIKALILDFLTAATDTTAMAAEWALAELINHPRVMEKAQKEIDQVVGKERLVEESDGPNLPYLQAIIKETFRLHPPIPMISRKSIQDCKIDKYVIPQGSLLFVNIWSMGRDPNVWPNPLNFEPERFLQSNHIDIDVRGQSYQLLPFGTGRRGCPGINLAMQELPNTLAAMIQCFHWNHLHTKKPLDMSERPGLTAPRANDLVCLPLPRVTPHLILRT